MVHHVASCHECGEEIVARDHCHKCNGGHDASYACPHCQGFILVGKHSIKPDVKRAKEERSKAIEAAALKLCRDWVACRGGHSANVDALKTLIESR